MLKFFEMEQLWLLNFLGGKESRIAGLDHLMTSYQLLSQWSPSVQPCAGSVAGTNVEDLPPASEELVIPSRACGLEGRLWPRLLLHGTESPRL